MVGVQSLFGCGTNTVLVYYCMLHDIVLLFYRSDDFRPAYGRVHEIRAFVPFGVPMLALTATVTDSIRSHVIKSLNMIDCSFVSESPNKANIMYSVRMRSSDFEEDFTDVIKDLSRNSVKAKRLIVYCRSLDMCANLYAHFHLTLGDSSYYPPGSPKLSDYRLFGMYHSKTPQHNKDVILASLTKYDGVVRVVFATMALGMGIDCVGLTQTIHYGAPRSIDDYFQECGRAGRGGQSSTSTIYWRLSDVPQRKDHDHKSVEMATVRRYLVNTEICRRYFLLHYFDPVVAEGIGRRDRSRCCDNCKTTYSEGNMFV